MEGTSGESETQRKKELTVNVPVPEEKPFTLWPGKYHSPVTAALWHASSSFAQRARNVSMDSPAQITLQSKTPEENRTSVVYKFSSDTSLREEYRNPWNLFRIGKLLEDLDALAGTIAVKHCSDSDHTTRPLLLVTASVDKISTKKRLRVDVDLELAGSVTWVGRSSMEIRMEVIQPVRELREKDDVALIANFTFVARDWRTQKAAPVNHLVPQTEEEKQLFAMGAARDAHRKKLRMGNQLSSTSPFAKEYNDRLTQILREVDVGDFVRLKSCVLYTETENVEQPRIHVEVIAHVTQPELKSSEVSNTFYFTFSLDPECQAPGVDRTVRRVLPATEEEARTYLARYKADHIVLPSGQM
ncbi:acyl-coenzyme A thioesterase 2, chloroplastic isoform X2 [Physcomitrium patens]|uniref:HotDog ACOT-type domain-containing protein n=1 Tax=Physcomitrium patens TaxID=3218 RepID=A0A7I4FQZ0_PHYPA|nr:acyl-coenzyme A thioesterase 9, mitochondrial-like isoform X2 [Physcomitrium patens]|eukprot:XP_024376061.1 acyl-coenzyme A thioesterase 9, mitochondrial-like isoform X2 [Physcomitrella patens]